MSLSARAVTDLNLGMPTVLQPNARRANDSQSRFVDRRPSVRIQTRKEIDLSRPYEIGLAAVFSLPAVFQNRNQDENLAKQFRVLYEAANGRQVMTALGPIGIAPGVAPWLKDAPLSFATREEFSRFVRKLTGAARVRLDQSVDTDRSPKKEEEHD